MAIGKNKVVTINYTLKDEEGAVIDSTENNPAFSYLSGNNQILPRLEEKIDEMLIGSSKNVVLEPKNAYGEYKEEAIQKVNKKEFPEGTNLEKGMSFVANTPEGKQMPFYIQEIEEEEITIDFNHPLAGKKLEFDVKLVDVRDATEEEITHGHAHAGDGHHN